MAHITTIGAGIYSDVSFSTDTSFTIAGAGGLSESAWKAFFATVALPGAAGGTGIFRRISNVREMPQFGTPPNIVNVPTYGFKTSKQVQGQADAPSFELNINFVPSDWASATDYLGIYVGNSTPYAFRITLLNSLPTTYVSTAGGLGTVQNTQYYFGGKLEALQINPQLTDSNQATVTVSVQTDFYGPWTS
jgi:hypothetical protein